MWFLVGTWWVTLLPCFVLPPVQVGASTLAQGIVLKARAVLQQEPSVSCQRASESPSCAATILIYLLKKGATTCPIFASDHYRLDGEETHLLTVTA